MTAQLSRIAASGHDHHGSHRSRWGPKVPVTISDSYVSLGWWMVMSDDEQGYAPAVYLEPVEENSANNDVHPEDSIDEGMFCLRVCVCVYMCVHMCIYVCVLTYIMTGQYLCICDRSMFVCFEARNFL